MSVQHVEILWDENQNFTWTGRAKQTVHHLPHVYCFAFYRFYFNRPVKSNSLTLVHWEWGRPPHSLSLHILSHARTGLFKGCCSNVTFLASQIFMLRLVIGWILIVEQVYSNPKTERHWLFKFAVWSTLYITYFTLNDVTQVAAEARLAGR